MIQYLEDDVTLPSLSIPKLNSWIKETANLYGKKIGYINYIFCSDNRILEINKQYLSHDYYTDIITFDYSEKNIISGDIFVSIETVSSNAVEFNTNYIEELHRVLIHGILHLCGQDDQTPEEQEIMTQKENKALKSLGN